MVVLTADVFQLFIKKKMFCNREFLEYLECFLQFLRCVCRQERRTGSVKLNSTSIQYQAQLTFFAPTVL